VSEYLVAVRAMLELNAIVLEVGLDGLRDGKHIGAVILAAGFGERMRGFGQPKPLAWVGGLTLLERTVRTLRMAGINGEVVVVVGHRGSEVAEYARSRQLRLKVVENPRYPQGNGTSVMAALPHVAERFVVSMADHVYPPDSVRHLLEHDGEFVAAVDTHPVFADPKEATRVRLSGRRVVDFGRRLEPYDALDAGLFLCSRPAMEQMQTDTTGPLTWNDFKRAWIASGREVMAYDLAGAPWIDVDTPEDLQRAQRLVIDEAIGGQDGLVSRYVNRQISRRLTKLLLNTPVTPNEVSLLSFGLAVVGGRLLMSQRMHLAAVLIQLSSILDCCDGEIARARLQSSAEGAVLDATLDLWAEAAIVSGMAVGARSRRATLLGFLASAGALVVPYTRAMSEASVAIQSMDPMRPTVTRDVRLGALALGTFLKQPELTLLGIGLTTNAEVIRYLRALRRWSDESALPQG
jgi:CDP-L-myo-inositol myo-inositolphosphotransferase